MALELHIPSSGREDRVISSQTDIFPYSVLGSPLANDNGSRINPFATKPLDS
jgi:hypothetical protein